jgi:uncharacterized protein
MTLLKTLSFSLLLLCAVAFVSTTNTHAADGPTAATAPAPRPKQKFNVLAFFNATYDQAHINYVHEANVWFPKMGQKHNFTYTATNNWNNLNKSFIADFQVILFLDDSPRDPAQRAAFQDYMEHGGGWMGFHVCAFTTNSHEWDWYYNHFLGSGNFRNNTWFPTTALLKIDDPAHPSMNGLPAKFTSCVSEWYSWTNDLAKNPDIDILASVDPACFPLGTDPNQSWYKGYYPIIWSNKNYKMIYANFGHNAMDYKADIGKSSTFASPDQDKFLLNALQWLATR